MGNAWVRLVFCALAVGCAGLAAGPTSAGPHLVIAVSAAAKDRAALHVAVGAGLKRRLAADLAHGRIVGYRLYASRYPDAGSWDALANIAFKDDTALSTWSQSADSGLDRRTLALAREVVTTPADLARSGGETGDSGPAAFRAAYLVVPYVALVSAGEYLKYLDDYTLPQFAGWREEKVLDGYTVLTSRYPAGRPWSSLIVLRYHDDAALARRDEVVAKVRAKLAGDPAWKAVSDNKKAVRTEKALAVADLIASGGAE